MNIEDTLNNVRFVVGKFFIVNSCSKRRVVVIESSVTYSENTNTAYLTNEDYIM